MYNAGLPAGLQHFEWQFSCAAHCSADAQSHVTALRRSHPAVTCDCASAAPTAASSTAALSPAPERTSAPLPLPLHLCPLPLHLFQSRLIYNMVQRYGMDIAVCELECTDNKQPGHATLDEDKSHTFQIFQ